jgi:hypothetical protein
MLIFPEAIHFYVHPKHFKKWLSSLSYLPVCSSEWNDSAPTGWIFMIFEHFLKICQEDSNFVNIWQEQQVLYMKTSIHF